MLKVETVASFRTPRRITVHAPVSGLYTLQYQALPLGSLLVGRCREVTPGSWMGVCSAVWSTYGRYRCGFRRFQPMKPLFRSYSGPVAVASLIVVPHVVFRRPKCWNMLDCCFLSYAHRNVVSTCGTSCVSLSADTNSSFRVPAKKALQ